MKGYKSQSHTKFTKIYPLYHVPPLGGLSKNDENLMIFGDLGKIHYFLALNLQAEMVKMMWD